MVVVFIYISVVSLIAIYVTTYAANLRQLVSLHLRQQRAINAAEAGLIIRMGQRYAIPALALNASIPLADFPDTAIMNNTAVVATGTGLYDATWTCDIGITETNVQADTIMIVSTADNW